MAEFVGTKKEFNRFFGPYLRNLVQHLTRKYRKGIGKCEHCGIDKKLESAHIKGKERIEIIDQILKNFYSINNYRVDLKEFENLFKKEHENLNEVILILCKDCHSSYDNKKSATNPTKKRASPKQKNSNRIFTNSEIQIKLTERLREFQTIELEKFFDKGFCKKVFNINFPLLLKTQLNTPIERKIKMVKDNGINRWSWKYEFKKENDTYAICTQWYEWNDEYVKNWLKNN